MATVALVLSSQEFIVDEVDELLFIRTIVCQLTGLLRFQVFSADQRPAVAYDAPPLILLHPHQISGSKLIEYSSVIAVEFWVRKDAGLEQVVCEDLSLPQVLSNLWCPPGDDGHQLL